MERFYRFFIIILIIFFSIPDCHKNSWPRTPSTPIGPSAGDIKDTLTFKASTNDPEGDDIAYQFDWGTGNNSSWSDFINSGDTITITHSWDDTGHYNICVRAMDIKEKVSRWSDTYTVNIVTNIAPNIPSIPSGLDSGYIDYSYAFSTTTTDPDGDSISYQFDWGDDSLSPWSSFVPSANSVQMEHHWSSEGTYNIKARAKDKYGLESDWSAEHSIIISTVPNLPPDTPNILSGPSSGLADSTYTFSANTTDPDGDSISYLIDWGDSTYSGWSTYVPSGRTFAWNHTYTTEGTYYIKAKAKDVDDAESEWSDGYQIIISSIINNPPDTPTTPLCPSNGYKDSTYTFHAITTDPNWDSVSYQFDWGDGNYSEWSDYTQDAHLISMDYAYSSVGTFSVKAKAKDVYGAESGWSSGHEIGISSIEYPSRVIKTVPAGDGPTGIDFLPNGEYAYITNCYSCDISVIKTSDHTIIESIPLGSKPVSAAALPSGEYVYINDQVDSCAYVIRTSDNTVIDTIKLGGGPHSIISLPNGEYMYATNSWTSEVSVIRTSDNTVVTTIPVGGDPRGLTVLPNGEYIYVGCMGNDRIDIIRTSDNTLIDNIPVPSWPAILTSHPNGNYVYCTKDFGGEIYVIETSTNTLIDNITVENEPKGIAILPTGDYIYVANRGSNSVSVIRESDYTIVKTIPVINAPLHIKATPDGNLLYVTHGRSDTVTVIGY
jgi:YVTN family beta-propeller protein